MNKNYCIKCEERPVDNAGETCEECEDYDPTPWAFDREPPITIQEQCDKALKAPENGR